VESFSDPGLLVLLSLAGGDKHGHAMLNDIEQMIGRRLGPGTLYGAISRLEGDGLIEPLPVDERRKPYRLTPDGKRVVSARVGIIQRIAAVGSARLAPG